MKIKLNIKRLPTFLLIAIITILATTPALYFYQKYRNLQKQLTEGKTQEDPALYVERASRHILLPTGELPTILTVSEKDRQSGQTFYANAKPGDKVLVFTGAKKAFLYDPAADKILEVGPVLSFASASAQANPTANPTPTPTAIRFFLYNGTTTVGLTKTYESKLKRTIPDAVIADRDNAKASTYTTSLLVDLTGKQTAQATELGKKLGLVTGSLPAGEISPPEAADFLIILGTDVMN